MWNIRWEGRGILPRERNQPSDNRRIGDTYSQVFVDLCYTLPIQPNPRIRGQMRYKISALASSIYFLNYDTPQCALSEISMSTVRVSI